MIIHGVGSGAIQKRHFAYHQFLSTPPESLNILRDISFKCMSSNSSPMRIYFSDINSDAINALKNNISSFQQSITREDESPLNSSPSIFEIPKQIDFFQCSLDQLVPITQNRVNQTMVLLLNPPYGLRLGKKSSPILLYQKVSRRVLDIYAHLCSNQSVTRNESNIEEEVHVPIMMGYCICSNQNTASLFTQGLDGKFNCHMHSFSHGGKERYVVSFISIK